MSICRISKCRKYGFIFVYVAQINLFVAAAGDRSEIVAEMERLNYMFEKNRIALADYDKKYTALENKLEKLEAAPVPVDLSHVRDFLNSDILYGKSGYFSRYKNYIRIISASRALWRALCGVFIACPDSLPLKN